MIKLKLKSLPPALYEVMLRKFSFFTSFLDGEDNLYLYGLKSNDKIYTSLEDLHEADYDKITAFAVVSDNVEYFTLEAIEVLSEYRLKGVSKKVLDPIVYQCSIEQKPLMLSPLSRFGKKYLLSTLDYLANKYSVYVMEEKEYLELRV